MSPENLKKLNKLRKKLDILDNSFIKLIKKRTTLVKQVLLLKKNKIEIIDKKRIKTILNQIRKKSINVGKNNLVLKKKVSKISKLIKEIKNLK